MKTTTRNKLVLGLVAILALGLIALGALAQEEDPHYPTDLFENHVINVGQSGGFRTPEEQILTNAQGQILMSGQVPRTGTLLPGEVWTGRYVEYEQVKVTGTNEGDPSFGFVLLFDNDGAGDPVGYETYEDLDGDGDGTNWGTVYYDMDGNPLGPTAPGLSRVIRYELEVEVVEEKNILTLTEIGYEVVDPATGRSTYYDLEDQRLGYSTVAYGQTVYFNTSMTPVASLDGIGRPDYTGWISATLYAQGAPYTTEKATSLYPTVGTQILLDPNDPYVYMTAQLGEFSFEDKPEYRGHIDGDGLPGQGGYYVDESQDGVFSVAGDVNGHYVVWRIHEDQIINRESPASTTIRIWLANKPDWNVDALTPSYFYTSENTTAWFSPARGNEYYWTQSISGTPAAGIVSLNALNTNNGGGVTSAHIIDNEYQIDIPNISGGQENVAAINPTTYAINWSAAWTRGVTSTWVQGSQTVVKIIDYHIQWNKAPGSEVRPFIITIYDREADLVYQYRADTGIGNDMTIERFVRSVSAENYFPKRIVDITHHYYSSALEWGSIANGTNGIMGTEDLTNSLGQSATYDVNWGPYTIIQRMQGTLSMAIYEEPPDVGRLTLHKSLSGWWELDWDVDPETPFGVYLKNAEGHYLIFGPMITDPSDENFGTYPCIGTVGQRSFADLLYVSEEVPLRLSKIPTVGEYTDDAQRELEWYVVEEIHDSALSDWDIDLITTTLRDVDGAELAARRTLARRWQDADGNMLWVDEHNPELGTYYQSGAINVAPSLTQDAPDPAFFDHETLTEIRLVKNEELEVTIQNDFGHGVGYLQIYKSIQGFPIQHNVDEDTVFYFRIWDVAAQNYLLFDPEVRPRYQAAWDAGVKTYWCIGNHVVGFTEEHAQARPAPIMDIPVKDNEIVRVANLWTWGEYEIHEVTPKDGVVGPEAEYTDMTDLFERGWNDVWAGISDHDRDITFDISGDRSKLDFALRGARWGAGQDIDERYGIDDVAYWGAGAWMYTDWEPLWERVPWVTGGDTGGTQLAEDTPWLVHYNYGSYFVPAENPEDDPVKVSGNRRLTFNETIMIRMSNWYQMGSVDIMLTKELGGYYTDWGIKATDFFDLRLHSIHPTYFEDSLAGGYWRDVQRTLVFERIPASRTAGFEYRVVGYIEPNGLLGPEGEVLYGTTDSTLLNSKPIGSLSGIDLYAIMSEGLEDVDDDEEEEGEDDVPAVPTNGAFYYELDATVDPDRLVLTIPVSQARPQWAFDVPINGHHIYVEEVLPQGNTKILNTTITYGRAGAEIDMNLARINPAYQAALNELIASGHHLGRSYAEEDAIFFANQRESYATWWTRFDAQFRATHGGTGYRGWQSTLGSAAVATYNLTEVPTIALFSDWYANYVAWLDAGNEDSDFAFVKQQGQTYEDWWLGEPEGTGFGAKFNAAGLTPRDWYAGWLESGSDEDYPGYTPDVHNFTTLFCGHMATVAEERVKAEEAAWNVYQNALHELYIAEHHFGRQYAEEDRLFQSHRGMSYAEWWEAFNTTFQEEHEMTYPNWLSGFNTRFSSQHGMPYVSWYNVWAQAVEKAGGNPRTYDPLTCKQQGETYDDWWARVFATGILEVQDSPYADWYSAYLDGSATIDPGDVEPLFNSLYCMHMTDVAVARNGAYTKRCGLQDYLDMPLDQDQHGISIDDLGTRELTVRVYNNYTASNGAMVVTKAFPEGIGDAWFETNSFYDTWPVDRNTPFYFKIFAPPGFLVGSPDMDALFDIETWDDLTDYFSFDPEEDGYVFNNTSGEASFAGIEDGYFSFTVAGSVTNPLRLFGLPPDGAFEIVEYWKDDPLDAAFAELVGNKFAMVDEESPRGWELVQWERDEEGDLLWPLGELAYVPIEDRLTVMGKPTTPWLRYEVDFQLLTHNDEETELQNTIATVSNYFAPGEGELEVTKVIAGLEPSWLTNPTDNSQTNPMDIGARLIAAAADGRAYTAGTRNTPLPPGVAEETYFLRVLDVTKLNYLLWTDAGETKPGDNGDPSIKVYRCVGNDVDGNSELVEPGTDGVLLEIKAGETIRLENLWTNREYRVEEVLPGDPDYPGDAPAYNYTVRYYSPEDENRDSNNFLNNGERSHVIVTNTYPSYYRVTYQDLIPDTGTMPVDETWYLEDDVATILPNDLEREGYTFEGWASDIADDDTLYTTGASLTMPDDDVVLTAVWEPIDYTVTYHSGGATGDVPVDDATYHLDDAVDVTEPTGLTKAGHRFMGWRSNLTDTPLLQPGEEVFTMPAKDVNLTAEWEQEYTLTYDANGYAEGIVPTDTPPNGTGYLAGESTKVQDPGSGLDRHGWTFMGWNTQADGKGTGYSKDATLTFEDADVTLYAQWRHDEYTVTYHNGGGTGDVPVDDAAYHADDVVDVAEPTDLTKAGHRFMGWRSDLADTPLLQPGEEVFTMPAKDVNLTAEWEQEYTLTYDANGYAEGIVPTDTPPNGTGYLTGESTTVQGPGTGLERYGWTFMGWNTRADGKGTGYSKDATLTFEDADVTLYAQWRHDEYAVTYDVNGGDRAVVDEDNPYYAEDTVTVMDEGDLVKEGYNFLGWTTEDVTLPDDEPFKAGDTFTMPDKDVTLVAVWEFRAGALTVNKVVDIIEEEGEYRFNDPENPYAFYFRVMNTENFEYLCFIKDPAAGEGENIWIYAGDESMDVGEDAVTEILFRSDLPAVLKGLPADVIYEIEEIIEYDDEFNAEFTPDYGEAMLDEMPDGGSLEATVWNFPKVTLYIEGKYRVYYDGNGHTGGTVPEDLNEYAEGIPVYVFDPMDPLYEWDMEREGYRFTGWNTSADGSGQAYLPTDWVDDLEDMFAGWLIMPDDDVTLYAQWERIDDPVHYRVTFHWNYQRDDDGIYYQVIVPGGQTVAAPADPVREHFTFRGWFVDAEATIPYNFDTAVTKDLDLYAGWTPTLYPPITPDHYAYLIGDDLGLIRPQASITRAEVATILFRLVTDDYRSEVWTKESPYPDVMLERWFNNPIATMSAAGVFQGMPNGTFAPDRAITRAEFATAVSRFFGGAYDGDDLFIDIAGHWARTEINTIGTLGWVRGSGNGAFEPNREITRAEVAAIINRIQIRHPETTDDLLDGMIVWPDNTDEAAWHYLDIQEATNSNQYEWKANGHHKQWTALVENRPWIRLHYPDSEPWHINN